MNEGMPAERRPAVALAQDAERAPIPPGLSALVPLVPRPGKSGQ